MKKSKTLYIRLDDKTWAEIERREKTEGKSKSEIARDLIQAGLQAGQAPEPKPTKAPGKNEREPVQIIRGLI